MCCHHCQQNQQNRHWTLTCGCVSKTRCLTQQEVQTIMKHTPETYSRNAHPKHALKTCPLHDRLEAYDRSWTHHKQHTHQHNTRGPKHTPQTHTLNAPHKTYVETFLGYRLPCSTRNQVDLLVASNAMKAAACACGNVCRLFFCPCHCYCYCYLPCFISFSCCCHCWSSLYHYSGQGQP